VWGNGYSVVQAFLLAPPLLSVIAGVFICKLLAVLASSGSGAPGGVFTPTLFVGMATGMLFAQLFALWLPGSETAILLGLAGMATLLAATTHAPIMSALMVCEMTGQYFYCPVCWSPAWWRPCCRGRYATTRSTVNTPPRAERSMYCASSRCSARGR
jgi:CIC family chloride channel protein